MDNILILCIGNICRSPMAAALMQHARPSTRVVSAGLAACTGWPADPWAVKLMDEQGIDISAHRGQQVSIALLGRADLVLVMDTAQQRKLESLYPAGYGKISRLCQLSGQDVPDPYGEGGHAFRFALGLIEAGVAEWADRLNRLADKQLSRDVV
jgi:protein-tyrosine phosphatase